ncbi:8-amino-7-oxononanoate synthase [uncultured Deefgea sp.]|uniref:8-amino-7-oxononanoate synthase n=1 Tax=uncultured Deefgea sp. TaxID=1304914 RepID=UPI0026062EAE|nr:8-amino-7-oxononanoate synthase [uncultured Deefgea sp.]
MTQLHWFSQLADELAERKSAHLYRSRRVLTSPQGAHVTVADRLLCNFCSNDYLGLANHPQLIAAAQAGAARWGVGSGASHLVAGHFAVEQQLEERLAAWANKPAAITLSTGYMANLAVITGLMSRGDAIFADKLNHASLNDAMVLSRADVKRFAHGDLSALARQLAASKAARKMIVVDAVFSMDGDIAPLAEMLKLADQYDALLYVDDAHGFGVLGHGRGTLAELGLSSPRIIYMATLGKAAGVAGAYIAAEQVVIDYLVNTAKPYIYTTAAPPLIAAAMHASLDLIAHDVARRERLQQHIVYFRQRLASACTLLPSSTAIQPIILPSSEISVQVSAALFAAGFWVAAIRPPTVATPRLRVVLSAAHTHEEVAALCEQLLLILAALPAADLTPATDSDGIDLSEID